MSEKEDEKVSLASAGFEEEELEIRVGTRQKSGFPKPEKCYRLWMEAENHSIEEPYFWILGHLTTDHFMHEIEKITDIMSASASSSIFGDMQARLTAQQNQANQLLGTVGRMVKDLFALVRELRQLRERIGYYEDSEKSDKEKADAAEKTLKGIWIDLVEGGTQNPSSVIGLAQKVGYTILPDLFFNAPPMKEGAVNDYVNSLEFNSNVKNMLTRKLFQFIRWKNETYSELKAKRQFQIRYLRQHFDSIRMYINWTKPYLKQIEQLQMQHNQHDNHKLQASKAYSGSGYLINSFQSSLTEIETIVYRKGAGKYNACVHLHFFYRTMPSMDFHAKDSWQQKGPIHVGRSEITFRGYVWTDEQIEKYKKLKEKEDWGLLLNIDESLMQAMQLLGDDLVEFLREADLELPEGFAAVAGQSEKNEKQEEPKSMSVLEPFTGIFAGFRDILAPLVPVSSDLHINWHRGRDSHQKVKERQDYDKTKSIMLPALWNTYKNFKKAHGMVTW